MTMTFLNLADDINKAVVFDCEDEATLRRWHEEVLDLRDAVRAQLEAAAGTRDPDWAHRAAGKAGVCGMALRWIERRMAQLDLDLPVTIDRAERRTILRLRAENRELRAQLHNAGEIAA